LAQGYHIGTEHADKRRFRASAWTSGPSIHAHNESGALSELDAVIAQHPGEYVRLVGIDPKAKRRVLELVIQRPDGKANTNGSAPRATASTEVTNSPTTASTQTRGNVRLSAEVVNQVRQILSQGLQVRTEHADKRRFRASAWSSCQPITAHRESEVIAALEACMAEHAGEYVRLLGVDTKAKRRVLETVIQRP
jgi:carbon dioxide concentrating mechanism protein CcmM